MSGVDLEAAPKGEELFPNDAPTEFQGQNLPDHGELWCQPWDFQIIYADGWAWHERGAAILMVEFL